MSAGLTAALPFGKSELSLLLHEGAPIPISLSDGTTISTRPLGNKRTEMARKKIQRKDEKAAAALVKTEKSCGKGQGQLG